MRGGLPAHSPGTRMGTAAGVLVALVWTVLPEAYAQSSPPVQEWKAVFEWEVGDFDGPLSFTRISDLAVSPDGRAFVAQPEYHEVWIIDARGRRTKVIGRKGQGPGEFDTPRALYWKADSLVVWDQRLFRLNLFSDQGDFSRSFMAPVMSSALGMLGVDGVVTVHGAFSRDLTSGRVKTQPLRLQNLRTGEIDTLAVLRVDHSMIAVKSGGGTGYGPQPFSDNPIWRTAPDGERLVLIDRAVDDLPEDPAFSVTIINASGERILTKQIPFETVPLEDATVDDVARETASSFRAFDEAQGVFLPPGAYAPQAFRDAFYVPRFYPPVEDLAFGPDGEIWLRRDTPAETTEVSWLVLGDDLSPIALVQLPGDLELIKPASDYLVAARKDDLDVYHLVRFRLDRSEDANGFRPDDCLAKGDLALQRGNRPITARLPRFAVGSRPSPRSRVMPLAEAWVGKAWSVVVKIRADPAALTLGRGIEGSLSCAVATSTVRKTSLTPLARRSGEMMLTASVRNANSNGNNPCARCAREGVGM